MTKRPIPAEYPSFFNDYVGLVPEVDVVQALRAQVDIIRQLAAAVPSERETYAYGPGKWTIRQMVGHLVDAERVFSFRALAFSRSDTSPLPGFSEDAYVEHANFNDIPLARLVDELAFLRSANLRMFESLDEEQWSAMGTANGRRISVRALAYVMVGHIRHHLAVLRDRYAVAAAV